MKTFTLKNNKDMIHFNLFNQDELSERKSRFLATRQLLRRVVAILLLALVGAGAWATDYVITVTSNNTTYYIGMNADGTALEAKTVINESCIWTTTNALSTTSQSVQNKKNTGKYLVASCTRSGYSYSWTLSVDNTASAVWRGDNGNFYARLSVSGSNRQASISATSTSITLTDNNTTSSQYYSVSQGTADGVTYYDEAGQYVITSANAHFLGGTSTADITTFSPSTCLWTGTSGGTWKNSAGYYLRNATTFISQTNSNFTLGGSESGTTGRTISNGTNYIRYNSSWERSTSTQNTNLRNVVFAVTKRTYLDKSTNPTISGDDIIATTGTAGSKTYTSTGESYIPPYIDYIFYNNADHYFKTDNSTALTAAPTSESFTYAWSLSDGSHASVDEDGKVTYNTYYDEDTEVTLTLTATSTSGKVLTATKKLTFEAPKTDPTGITATIDQSTIYVGGTGQVSYTLQGTPCYDNVTFSSSNTSVATVHANTGVVTAIGVGTATITATAHHYTTEGTDKTATVFVTVKNKVATPVISFEPTSTDGGETATATITCATEGAAISYSTDGGTTWTTYSEGFTVNNLDEVKAKAVKSGDYWDGSDVATATYSKHKVATPTITINNGKVSFSCDEEGDVTYYYTTDGSTPTTGSTEYTEPFTPTSDECTIKVIATMTGAQNSDVAERLYVVQSGISDSKVILNDYEDHNWTYYAGVDASVDGGHYNTAYRGKLYSPNPRNVKITYNGVNNVTGSTTVVKVSTKTGEGQNTFVYYKTLEQGATSGEYPYQVISNPFSVRPSTGTGTGKVYYGFNGWKIVSGGDYIKNYNDNDVIPIDAEITFENLPYSGANCTSAEIVLQTTWSQANVQYGGGNVSNFNGGDYEHNFCVINANYAAALAPSYPVTITSAEPDGSATYNVSFSNLVTPVSGAANTTKLEYISWAPNGNIDARGRNLTIGRGVTTSTSQKLYGTNQTAGTSNVVNQVLKIESGSYSSFNHFNNSGTNCITKQIVVFGCDYDRAKNDNAKLTITGQMIGGTGGGAGNESRNHDANLFTNKSYMKSGTFMTSVTIAGAEWDHSYYLGINGASGATGKRLFEMEGGYLDNNIAGGMDISINGIKNSDQYINVFIRIRGGHVSGSIYGGARFAESQGSRQIVLTGGEVNGWIAGGANGNETDQGGTEGASYIYVGGNAIVGGEGSETSIGSSIGGCVYGAGCGYGPNSSSGEMGLGTNVVVADNAYVERGVYGGGAFGYCAKDQTANIYITGGHVEGKSGDYKDRQGNTTSGIIGGVFGGSRMRYGGSANIYMTGGWVETGVYGGSNHTGTMEHDVNMVITGGQVGTDATHTGNVHGGGYGATTEVSGNVDVTLGTRNTSTGETAGSAVIYGDVYGGSALGNVNGTSATTTYHTNVTLNAGTIHGSLYGGALGNSSTAANVYGPVAVKVYGGSVKKTDENGANGSGAVYGANNINGAPQRSVTVDIYGTDPAPAAGGYALFSVYGGGNAADYSHTYAQTNGYPTVTVHNCDNSIEYVYGGGNAAAVAATDVTIYGGNKIGNVFGGGNGQVQAANVTPGGTNVKIYGGTIGDVYGGSNTNGTIGGTISVTVNSQAESTSGTACSMAIDNVYGGGNKAASNAGTVNIGCTGPYVAASGSTPESGYIRNVYGGANQADITGNIGLNIKAGHIDNVFGGNNNSGSISGNITVTVNEDLTNYSCGMLVDNVYGGGNKAAYGTGANYPVVNIQNGHLTGSVFGGGLGSTAVVTGNPQVTIGTTTGTVHIDGNVFGGGDAADVAGSPVVLVQNCNTTIGTTSTTGGVTTYTNGSVYGGGNAAHVTGSSNSTSVTINGGTINRVFGGGNGEVSAANVAGNAATTIHGGTIHQAFAGSNAAGTISGTAKITVDNDNTYSSCTETIDEVYGGGNLAAGNAGTVEIKCGATVGDVYGGANAADVTSAITLDITGGTIGRVFGGNNTSGNITGSITVNIDKASTCESFSVENVYGAGNQAAYAPSTPGSYPAVNIKNGTVTYDVYGGGLGSTATVTSNPTVLIDGGTVSGNVFGGGSEANTVGTTSVTIKTGTVTKDVYGGGALANVTGNTTVSLTGGTVTGNTYGGGLGQLADAEHSIEAVAAMVTGNTTITVNGGKSNNVFGCNNLNGGPQGDVTVTITTGTITNNVYGGGNLAAATADPEVTVNGGTMKNVYGGGLGESAVITGDPVVNISKTATDMTVVDVFGGGDAAGVTGNTTVNLTAGTVTRAFGGGNLAAITGTTAVNLTGATAANVYGGGNEAGVSSTTTIAMSAGSVTTGLYGGCNTNGTVGGNITVGVTGGTIGTDATHRANVHGGGYGNATETNGDVTVNIGTNNEGALSGTAVIYGDIYGGSALGNVNNATTDKTNVTLNSGTIYGDLYGGGLGDASNAADVTGSTVVTINGGTVNNVFGCNNANGDPAGASVTVNGGTINNNVYGGGNLAAAAVSPVVTINNGTLPGSVFGGGKGDPSDNTHEIAMVTGNPQVVIGDDNGSHSVSIAGNVFGGGDAANVKGATTVTVNKCNTLIGAKTDGVWSTTAGTVYGGGNAADVVKNGSEGGSTSVIVNGGDIYRVFGGGNGEGVSNPGANVANGTSVDIHAGNIHQAFAGSNAKGNITGTSVVTIDHDISTCNELVDEVYGGGNLAAGNAGTITVECGAVIGDLYGGANQADIGTSTDPCDITLNVTGGSINRVFGGNNTSGNVTGKITVNINKADDCSTFSVGTVYGAGNQASYTPTTVGAYPEINILKGTVTNDVFGGGLGASATVTSSPIVNINGGNVGGAVYGGGSLASVTGSTTVNLKNANSTVTGNIYGGGLGCNDCGTSGAAVAANISGSTAVNISLGTVANVFGCNNINGAPATGASVTVNGGDISNNVYGGGNLAAASVSPVVTINNGTLPGSVFGGGLGASAIITGNPLVTIGNHDDEQLVIIRGNVFGGGDAANVAGKPKVVINDCNTVIGTYTEEDGTIVWDATDGTVYGGGNAADITGSGNGTDVTINGGKIHRAFGGGNGAGEGNPGANVAGNTLLTIKGGTVGEAFGGSNARGTIGGEPNVVINNADSDCELNILDIYGGGNETPSAGGHLIVEGCTHIRNVYGGANNADITSDIEVTIKSGYIQNVFGGNNNGGNIAGSIIVNIDWDGSVCWNVDNVYGAGNLATYTAPTASSYGDKAGKFPEVNIKNGKVNYNVFGGGLGATAVVTGNPQVNLTGGSCQNIYGGGNAAPVTGSTNVTINATSRPAEGEYHVKECVFGGGLGATAVISNDTHVTVTGNSAIHGNVYGGGNAGEVQGSTHIDIK